MERKRDPLAYLITFTTYGHRLPGASPVSVDRRHSRYGDPFAPCSPSRERAVRSRLREPPFVMDRDRRIVVLNAIVDACRYREWAPLAVHVRRTHAHCVVTALASPETVMNVLKKRSTRALRDRGFDVARQRHWARHGSTRYLWDERSVIERIDYVLHGQGDPMETYSSNGAAPEPSRA